MAKKILIPIDFKVESLNTLKLALANQNDPVDVVLLYGRTISDSIIDLLFYCPKKEVESLTNKEFQQALEIITNRFGRTLNTVKIELLNANSLALLRNLLNHLRTDVIYIPKNYKLFQGKKAFDPIPLLKNTHIKMIEVEWNVQTGSNEKDQLQSLFNWA